MPVENSGETKKAVLPGQPVVLLVEEGQNSPPADSAAQSQARPGMAITHIIAPGSSKGERRRSFMLISLNVGNNFVKQGNYGYLKVVSQALKG